MSFSSPVFSFVQRSRNAVKTTSQECHTRTQSCVDMCIAEDGDGHLDNEAEAKIVAAQSAILSAWRLCRVTILSAVQLATVTAACPAVALLTACAFIAADATTSADVMVAVDAWRFNLIAGRRQPLQSSAPCTRMQWSACRDTRAVLINM